MIRPGITLAPCLVGLSLSGAACGTVTPALHCLAPVNRMDSTHGSKCRPQRIVAT